MMKKGGYILFYVIFLIACEKDDVQDVFVSNVSVLNTSSSALVSKVLFNTNTPVKGSILYWKKGESEKQAKSSVIGSNTTTHKIPILALSEDTQYNYRIMWNGGGDLNELRSFTTKKIPNWVKEFYDEDENKINEENDGYYLFHNKSLPACAIVVNKSGKIVWYRTSDERIQLAKVSKTGTLFTIQDDSNNAFGSGNTILETTFDGDTLSILKKDVGNVEHFFHHDFAIGNNGNIVALVEIEKNGFKGEGIEIFNSSNKKIWEWSSFDEIEENTNNYVQPWANSISITSSGNFLVSFRAISQIWKINASSGNVIWKLGKNGDFTLDTNSEFMFQHDASETSDGKIVLFDNGSVAQRPQSRFLEITVDRNGMTASESRSHYLPSEYFSPFMGSVRILENNEMLLASGTKGKVINLNADGSVKWTLTMHDKIYRVEYFKGVFD